MSTNVQDPSNSTPSSSWQCASCGVTENNNNDIILKKCAACHLVRYCSVKCQKEHRPEHKAACKKRAAEIRDEILFRQPESSHLGDCPICLLPLPLVPSKSVMQTCCGKVICNGCTVRHIAHLGKHVCPFCRHEYYQDDAEAEVDSDDHVAKRIKANDPVAIREEGIRYGKKGDIRTATEYFKKAAALGDAEAHYQLGMSYARGIGVERDVKKENYHLEEAAIGGHPAARVFLGNTEIRRGNTKRAVKHCNIAATLGLDAAADLLREFSAMGLVQKEDIINIALRTYQAAVDATKSLERDQADKSFAEFSRWQGGA